ncbi:MAG: M16 family metallopeptidase [Pyrinomonadaceae bacterium]
MKNRKLLRSVFGLALVAITFSAATVFAKPNDDGIKIPVTYYKLDNGLKVVLSPEHSVPLTTVGVYYNIGFRIEPKDRTGFAHLFEHLMFQGSSNLGKMEYIKLVQDNGGVLNGSTRFDFTNYFAVVPANKLEPVLWAEADRMRGLKITEENLTNQKGVVSNEVKVNVLNRPYGGFPWIDLPVAANTNWYNAHNFYGDLKDIDAATLNDAKDFFKKYYSPSNAVVVVVGDYNEAETKKWIEKYFGSIPSQKAEPKPDISEPRQTEEKIVTKTDALATKPAIAVGYQMPARGSKEYYAMGVLQQILLEGDDSRLYKTLVKDKGYTSGISGGINGYLGDMFNYNGPMLFMFDFTYDEKYTGKEVLSTVDNVIDNVEKNGVSQEEINRALVKFRSGLYDQLTQLGGFGRVDLLASFALFDNNPSKINEIEGDLRAVTPELIVQTAREYLRKTNRTVIFLEPGKGTKKADNGGAK